MSNNIPRLFKNTRTVRKIKEYMDTEFTEVLHTTLNPNGPGAIRIHLIPPKKEEDAFNPSISNRSLSELYQKRTVPLTQLRLTLHPDSALVDFFFKELLHGASGAAGRSARARASAAGSACTAGGAGRSA